MAIAILPFLSPRVIGSCSLSFSFDAEAPNVAIIRFMIKHSQQQFEAAREKRRMRTWCAFQTLDEIIARTKTVIGMKSIVLTMTGVDSSDATAKHSSAR